MTRQISEIVGGDYFVLPSSIHEVLILPDHGQIPVKDLLMMVKEVNEAEVLPEEQLGNKVLHFRADLQKLQVAAELDRTPVSCRSCTCYIIFASMRMKSILTFCQGLFHTLGRIY